MNQKEIYQINVQEIVNAKAPKQAKKIPKFLLRGLAKLICQDRINEFLRENKGDTGVDLMNNAMDFFHFSLEIIGEENIPDFNRKCIFASNHPLGGVDGICLSSYLGNRYNQHIRFLVNDILFFIEPLQTIFVPINKHGSQGRNAVLMANEALASDNQIITFPAGLNSRKNHGVIRDPEWKKMFIVKAIENKRDIVPIFFDSINSNTFYNVAIWRKRLKINFNIEMLFLPKEMIKKENSTMRIYFGKPIPWQTFDKSKTPLQWAEWVKQIVYNMSSNTSVPLKLGRY